jgi:DNA-binding Lrp family transcriptional regulator
MAIKAFLLIETAIGKTREVATTLRDIAGIDSADVVTGPFDIIAVINVEDFTKVGLLVTEEVHTIPGIVRATSYPVVDL